MDSTTIGRAVSLAAPRQQAGEPDAGPLRCMTFVRQDATRVLRQAIDTVKREGDA